MGKARGVSRGFMHTPNSAVTEPNSTVCPSACTSDGGTLHTTGNSENRNFLSISRDAPVINSLQTEVPSVSAISSAITPQSSIRNVKAGLLTLSPEISDVSASNSESETRDRYNSQQLPVLLNAKYPEFSEIVEPFPCMDVNEWLAAHTIALFDNLSTIFDAIYELCECQSIWDAQKDPTHNSYISSLPLDFQHSSFISNYLNSTNEDDRGKKSKVPLASTVASNSKVSARLAIDCALSACHDIIQSPKIFPVRSGQQFSLELPHYVSVICKNLFICIIHIYIAHFDHLDHLELLPHMNTLTKHFFAFTKRFSLVDEKYLEILSTFREVMLDSHLPDDATTTTGII